MSLCLTSFLNSMSKLFRMRCHCHFKIPFFFLEIINLSNNSTEQKSTCYDYNKVVPNVIWVFKIL